MQRVLDLAAGHSMPKLVLDQVAGRSMLKVVLLDLVVGHSKPCLDLQEASLLPDLQIGFLVGQLAPQLELNSMRGLGVICLGRAMPSPCSCVDISHNTTSLHKRGTCRCWLLREYRHRRHRKHLL